MKRLSDLLINGAIMNESFQAYESHVPYNLQFLMDHNLFGMNWIYLRTIKFRRKPATDPDEIVQSITCKFNILNNTASEYLREY